MNRNTITSECAALYDFEEASEAQDFIDYICQETGRAYERLGSIAYVPEGVGFSQKAMMRDITEFRINTSE